MSRRGVTAASGGVIDPVLEEITATGLVPKPDGATGLVIEGITQGGGGSEDETAYYAGEGGAYVRRDRISVESLTGVHVTVGLVLTVRENNSGGTVLANAQTGNAAATYTGDVKYRGGAGGTHPASIPPGGGAAGKDGAGYAADGLTPPTSYHRGGYLNGYSGHDGTDRGYGANGVTSVGGAGGALLKWFFD